MRNKVVIGNWKMNTNLEEAYNLVADISKLKERETISIILPPLAYIKTLQNIACPNLKIGAQNLSEYSKGAYTGEISAQMLQSIGVKYVCIGHSERRTLFNECNNTIQQKMQQAINNKLKPILCCGESLDLRKENKHLDFIKNQILSALQNIDTEDFSNIIIAYEPIWAIGTGETATATQAQEVHAFIRNLLAENFGENIAENMTILYGGSVKPSNASALFAEKDIDGALVGGASLKAEDFVQIINANN